MLKGIFLKNVAFLVTVRFLGGNHASFLMCELQPLELKWCRSTSCSALVVLPINQHSGLPVLLPLLHLSAYSFIFSFLVTSACLISGEVSSYCTRGKVDLSFLPFSNSEVDFRLVL